MLEDDKEGLHNLIEQELHSDKKISKPDFSQRTGREFLTSAPAPATGQDAAT